MLDAIDNTPTYDNWGTPSAGGEAKLQRYSANLHGIDLSVGDDEGPNVAGRPSGTWSLAA